MNFTREEWERCLIARHGSGTHLKLQSACVAVCGLGGMGSNVAYALSRAGIGKLILIDCDRVDLSNLHRQQYKACQIGQTKAAALSENIKEIAPFVEIASHTVRMDESNIKPLCEEADIICEAFDNAQSKAMLVNFVLNYMPDKYIIASSGMAGFESANLIKTRKITDRFYLCGDGKTDVDSGTGLISSRVTVCAAHAAHAIICLIAGKPVI